MGVFEIIIFGALAIWLIIEAGSSNTLSVFTTHYATVEGIRRHFRRDRRLRVLHPRVHRLRVGGASGRRGP